MHALIMGTWVLQNMFLCRGVICWGRKNVFLMTKKNEYFYYGPYKPTKTKMQKLLETSFVNLA